MKDISIVQRLVTAVMVVLIVVIGVTVLLKKEVKYELTPPESGPTPTPTFIVYPNNGKE